MSRDDITRELQELRRGRGLHADDLHGRIGPLLRIASGITDTDTAGEARRKLTLRVAELCSLLPADLQLVAQVAFGLHREAEGRFLDRRVQWLATHFGCDPKTVRRRLDEACRLLAEHLVQRPRHEDGDSEYGQDGWYLASVRAVLRMDTDPPQLIEERTIVATVDSLDEVVLGLASPPEVPGSERQGRITAAMIYGADIVERRDATDSYARFVLCLPEPLNTGQRHELAIQFTSYPRSMLRPYYVLMSLRRCDHLSVRVRFPRHQVPKVAWPINGVPQRVIDGLKPSGSPITINQVGDVSVEFYQLKPGLNYGLHWPANSENELEVSE
jgi:hypothetical protein